MTPFGLLMVLETRLGRETALQFLPSEAGGERRR